MDAWILCVSLVLSDPHVPALCFPQPSHARCTESAQTWIEAAWRWEARSHVSGAAAACWPASLAAAAFPLVENVRGLP